MRVSLYIYANIQTNIVEICNKTRFFAPSILKKWPHLCVLTDRGGWNDCDFNADEWPSFWRRMAIRPHNEQLSVLSPMAIHLWTNGHPSYVRWASNSENTSSLSLIFDWIPHFWPLFVCRISCFLRLYISHTSVYQQHTSFLTYENCVFSNKNYFG